MKQHKKNKTNILVRSEKRQNDNYSRDLRYMATMIESMINLPDDMFRQELLPYFTVYDIVKLDNACMNHEYRPQLLEKISGVILTGDKNVYMKASLCKWLAIRRIYLIN